MNADTFSPPSAGLAENLETAALALALVGVPLGVGELLRLWRGGQLGGRRVRGMLTSALCLFPAALVELLFGGVLLAIFAGAAHLAPFSIAVNGATAIVCLLLVDLTYYWEHRAGHRVHLLWALYHSVHHSADHYDQSIGLRISFVDFFITPWFYLPLVLVGFSPLLVLGCFAVVLGYQQWIHTEWIRRVPLLEGVLNTPSSHRVHHGRNERYLDRNYGGILVVWDRLFGTWAPETEPVDFGVVERLESRHPLDVHFFSLGKLWRAVRAAPSVAAGLALLLGPPEAAARESAR